MTIDHGDYDGHNLVFLVGCPRSGTTWLQRLLSSHPSIQTGQESNLVDLFLAPLLQHWRVGLDPIHRGGMGLAAYFTEEEFLNIVKSLSATLVQPMIQSLHQGELFLEKTPTHALYIPEILQLFPKSRIIHIVRDPRDVTASFIAASRSWAPGFPQNNAKEAAKTWVQYMQTVRSISPHLPNWQFHEVRYEDLHRVPIPTLQQCVQFLGLEWSEADLEKAIAQNQPAVAQATGGGTPIPLKGEVAKQSGPVVVEPPGFIRKGQVGSWQSDLTLQDKFWVWRVARYWMAEMGYPWPWFFRA